MRLLCLAAALLVLLERGQTQQHDLTVAANEGASAEQEREQAEDEEDEPARHFKATREWQEVQPGEVLPRGVHVRLDLETGRREAKRLDDEEPGESQKRTDVSKEGRLLLEEAKDDSSKSLPYDTAVDFIRMDGLLVIVPDLNSTSETLRELVAFTLGSALQGNPQVQSSVLEFGLLPQLLRLVAMDPSSRVRSRCLFALSCLVRHLPAAQEALMHHGGLTVLAGLFAMGSSSSAKLQLKAVTLIHDLLVEQRLRQGDDHAQVNKLQEGIQLYGFCSLVPELLQSPDVDAQEKVVQAMLSLAEICHKEFQVHLPRLHSLLNAYQREVHSESQLKTLEQTSDYFEGLLHSLSQLLDSLERKQKDEL
ncbi:nucleotide exchange factor SIL1 isoform X5 [Ixodes scapularis]|uniref:nucleotide exchange factor SIL1 isoform X5 n=1 Tax=Ixodes scapularis TaxID=6945 RepID=UPI001C38EC93|nr:nucleotide exchange factor SIL1 isoform X5 [Ixodes scapularis]